MLKRVQSVSGSRSLKSAKSYTSHKSILTMTRSAFEDIKEFEVWLPELCVKYELERDLHVKKEYRADDYYKHLQVSEAGKRRRTIVGVHQPHSAIILRKNSIAAKTVSVTGVTKETAKESAKETAKESAKSTAKDTGTDVDELELDINTIIMAAIYDSYNRLVEVLLYKVEVPRELIIILSFIARYYIDLKRIKIQFCKKISGATLYEISKLIYVSSITEIDLDGSYCKAGNYGILFDSGRIINMSLSKCFINDEVCEIIASKIGHKGPAEKNLYSLCLSSNHITDIGAKTLADALRSNRKLRYLNLAANHITDTGASYILDSLKEFPLTTEEVMKKSKRYMEYERKRMIFYWRCLHDSDSQSEAPNKKTNGKRKSTAFQKSRNSSAKSKDSKKDQFGRSNSQKGLSGNVNLSRELLQQAMRRRSPSHRALMNYQDKKNRAQILAGEMMGPFHDPFQSTNTTIREGKCYSKGNISLCHLNLAFNHLGYHSVVKLLDVLRYQNETKTMGQIGLVRVIIKGNNMPVFCEEYAKVDELLTKSMKASGGRAFADIGIRRKSRTPSIAF